MSIKMTTKKKNDILSYYNQYLLGQFCSLSCSVDYASARMILNATIATTEKYDMTLREFMDLLEEETHRKLKK